MPLKVKGLLFSIFFVSAASNQILAQQNFVPVLTPNNAQVSSDADSTNKSANIPHNLAPEKLTKVRAMVAARSFSAAANDLEKIKKEVSDDASQSVIRVMLLSIYLEQPNYDRAKNLLIETFERNKSRRSAIETIYLPVAGQVIKGAYGQLERYKKLGFTLSDANLPDEAVSDLDKWRKMLELVVEQSRQMSLEENKSAESLAILEQAAGARCALASDEYEAAKWRNAMDDTREMIANSQSKVTDVDGSTVLPEIKKAANNVLTANAAPKVVSVPLNNAAAPDKNSQNETAIKSLSETANAEQNKNFSQETPILKKLVINNSQASENEKSDVAPEPAIVKVAMKSSEKNDLVKVGSLVEMATQKSSPSYPTIARSARISGIVKVEIVVDETGAVKEIKHAEGPEMLRRAATEAVRRWKFKPMMKDGQAVAMSGFVNFNFAL